MVILLIQIISTWLSHNILDKTKQHTGFCLFDTNGTGFAKTTETLYSIATPGNTTK